MDQVQKPYNGCQSVALHDLQRLMQRKLFDLKTILLSQEKIPGGLLKEFIKLMNNNMNTLSELNY